jgi:hypothetical protein
LFPIFDYSCRRGGIAVAILLIFGTSLAPCLSATEYIYKPYREFFLSPELQKKYYKIEVQTYRFLNRQHSDVNGLIESFRGSSRYSYDMFSSAFCYGKGGVLDCQSFTYDGAVAAIAYALSGNEGKAKDILKVYRKEFYWLKSNDMVGLYNSYRSDTVSGDRALSTGIDGDRMHLGPGMWVGIAALQYTALTGDLEFLGFMIDMAKWARQLPHYEFPDGVRGGVCMGSGWGPDWSIIFSTENNVDYYGFLKMLKEIYERGGSHIKKIYENKNYGPREMDYELDGIKRWLKDVAYDTEKRTFNCGYNEKGPDRTRALDTVSWTIAALGPGTLKEMGINPYTLIDFAERKFSAVNTINGQQVKGFDFTDPDGRQKKIRLIWLEGTGQQIVTYQLMSDYSEKIGVKERADEYRQKAIKYSEEMEKVSMLAGLIDNALPYVSRQLGEKEVLFTFDYGWEIPRGNKGQWVASVSSTVWRYFAASAFNPLVFDRDTVNYKLFAYLDQAQAKLLHKNNQ